FYGQTGEGLPYAEGITADALIEILAQLPPGVTELGCHPGVGEDPDTRYASERAQEVKALCDHRVRSALLEMGIELRSFSAVRDFSIASDLGSVPA
ncbi:MAG TPA: ChbG/HpnK family deacetylase, partial [Candidatus Dormibacteraeota bacterium]|nr:ChbG/HpnK family deacetylase [Candidatus Dormibacteraeota bacterium]